MHGLILEDDDNVIISRVVCVFYETYAECLAAECVRLS
jgi:hypothetical protein